MENWASLTSIEKKDKRLRMSCTSANCCHLFLSTDVMNHCDFLKYITDLGKNDHELLIEMLEHFSKHEKQDRAILP